MANKLILDFENETVEWDTDCQKGIERYPGLKNKEAAILQILDYETVDVTGIIDVIKQAMSEKKEK